MVPSSIQHLKFQTLNRPRVPLCPVCICCKCSCSSCIVIDTVQESSTTNAICSLRPQEVLSTGMRMYDSIALGRSCLLDFSSSLTAGSLQQTPMSHCSGNAARYFRNHAPSWRHTLLCQASSGSEVVHMLDLYRFFCCNHALRHILPDHTEEAPMTKINRQPLLPHPASAVQSRDGCRFHDWPEVA